MALTYDQISAITEKKFIPKMVDNIFNSNALLQRLKKKEKPQDGGTSVMVPINYATTSSGGWYQQNDTLSTTDNDQITAFEFNWKQLYANITISRLDELKNSGDAQIVNFVKAKVEIAEKTIKDTLGTALYNVGTAADQIVGLRLMVDSTGTYGGISRSDYSWAAAQENSTATLTISLMQTVWGACSIGNDVPTVLTGTQTNFDRYYSLLQPQQRFMDEEVAKGGFTSLMFNGAPFVVDSKCPANHIFFLNEAYIDLMPHKDENFRFEPFMKPINQNLKTAKIYWTGVLACSNPRMQGKLDSLTA